MYENYNDSCQPDISSAYPASQSVEQIVDNHIETAFGKGLAATIMCSFPIASIIAIGFGNTALNLVNEAKMLSAEHGVATSGKIIAANILGKIGKIAGIAYTVFWPVYVVYFILLFLCQIF